MPASPLMKKKEQNKKCAQDLITIIIFFSSLVCRRDCSRKKEVRLYHTVLTYSFWVNLYINNFYFTSCSSFFFEQKNFFTIKMFCVIAMLAFLINFQGRKWEKFSCDFFFYWCVPLCIVENFWGYECCNDVEVVWILAIFMIV